MTTHDYYGALLIVLSLEREGYILWFQGTNKKVSIEITFSAIGREGHKHDFILVPSSDNSKPFN